MFLLLKPYRDLNTKFIGLAFFMGSSYRAVGLGLGRIPAPEREVDIQGQRYHRIGYIGCLGLVGGWSFSNHSSNSGSSAACKEVRYEEGLRRRGLF